MEPRAVSATREGTMTDHDRIEALENRLTHQERALAELSSELFDQARRLERLEKLQRELASKLKDVAESVEEPAPGNVRPPHW